MSYPRIQSTAGYLGALNDEDCIMTRLSRDDNQGATLNGRGYLSFMNFEAGRAGYMPVCFAGRTLPF